MPEVCSCSAIRVRGKAQLQVECGDADSYSIRTGRTVGAGLGLELDGVRLPWGQAGAYLCRTPQSNRACDNG